MGNPFLINKIKKLFSNKLYLVETFEFGKKNNVIIGF